MKHPRLLLGVLLAALTVSAGALSGATPGQAAAPRVSGFFHLKQQQSGRCADVRSEDGQTSAGARIQLKPCQSGNANQAWVAIRVSAGTYLLGAQVSGMCMQGAGGTSQPGTQVVQEPCDGGNPSQWFIYNGTFPTPSFTVLPAALGGGQCLDSSGSFVKFWPCVIPASVAQSWVFTS